MVRVIALTIVAFLLTIVVVYAAVLFGVIGYWELTGYVDREGAGSMGLAFGIAPAISALAGFTAAIVTFVRASRRRRESARPA